MKFFSKTAFFGAGLGAVALMTALPFANLVPGLAPLGASSVVVAQSPANQGPVKLLLTAERQVTQQDQQGNKKVAWQSVGDKANVGPRDVLRYTVKASNVSNRPVKNLVVVQPVPKGMVYVLNSATLPKLPGASVTYSIDGRKTFVANPTVKVKLQNGKVETRPAPAEVYTHIRWNLGTTFAPNSFTTVSYEAKVP